MDSAGGMAYYVNPEGQRLRKTGTAGTTWFAPDQGGSLLAENPNGAWVDYVWLNGRLIGRMAGGQAYAIHDDQVGRPEAVTDASQTVVWRAQNFAFTQNVIVANVAFNLGFPGQYYDAETAAWNNGFRDYKSGLGRYLENDPIGLRGGINSYAYVGGNPLSYTDPYGLWAWGDPLPQGLVDGVTGFGDGVYSAFTFGHGDLQDVRNHLGVDGGVDKCSTSYRYAHTGGCCMEQPR
jgi:RHS repeat-associated core domain